MTPSWPRAIVHIDGDAFFASCEQAINPALRGKPVVTGKERNIVAAASYEAKVFGVHRGVALWDARKLCPGLVVLPSDYETYSLFSKRLFTIIRRYTPDVEEYSIDEAFADLTGLRRFHRAAYETIAARIQEDVSRELGITVSAGVSITKTLAKIASKKKKPAGRTIANGRSVTMLLADLPIEDVWNIGPQTAALLKQYGLDTAGQFADAPELFVKRLLTKPGLGTWQELNGHAVFPLNTSERTTPHSISKTKTFTPPSQDAAYVFAHLAKNVENAALKARRYQLAPRMITIVLRTQEFRSVGIDARLSRPTAFPLELLPLARTLFERLVRPATKYRATGVVLKNLVPARLAQLTLFEDPEHLTRVRRLYDAVDALRERYGKYVVHHATSLAAHQMQHLSTRGDVPERARTLLPRETKRRRLPLPLWQGIVR